MSQEADIDTIMPEAPQVYVNDIIGSVSRARTGPGRAVAGPLTASAGRSQC